MVDVSSCGFLISPIDFELIIIPNSVGAYYFYYGLN